MSFSGIARFRVRSSLAVRRVALVFAGPLAVQPMTNDRYTIEPTGDGGVQVSVREAGTWTFRGDFAVLNPPFRFADVACSAVPLVGALGEHTREVLEGVLAIDPEQFRALAREGAFGA